MPSCFYLLPLLFFFNDTATTEIYTLSLHDALPICDARRFECFGLNSPFRERRSILDRKSTRLNSSHANISYAVFCFKKNSRIAGGGVPGTLGSFGGHAGGSHRPD